jgi:hypothetical protein
MQALFNLFEHICQTGVQMWHKKTAYKLPNTADNVFEETRTMKLAKHTKKIVSLSTLGAIATLSLGSAFVEPAQAIGTQGKKNIAIAGAAVGAYGLAKGKKKTAIVGGAVAAGSYLWYRKSKKKEEQRRRAWYIRRYGNNWRKYYKPGV